MPGLGLLDAVEAFSAGQAGLHSSAGTRSRAIAFRRCSNLTVALGQVNGHIALQLISPPPNSYLNSRPDVVHRFVSGYSKALSLA